MTKQNELTRSSKVKKKNKELLKSEINKATDPNVRLELTKMLLDLESKEKKNRVRLFFLFFTILIIVVISLYFMGQKGSKEENKLSTISSSSSSKIRISSEKNKLEETQLSTDELEKWVMSVLEYAPTPPSKYILDTYIDDKDNLAYVSVGVYQTDGFGTFRVNTKGQLEYKPQMYMGDWILMSEKYMDTSIAIEYFKKLDEDRKKQQAANREEEKQKQMSFHEAVTYAINMSDKWIDLTDEEKENLKIESVNESLSDVKRDEYGEYYSVVLETNKEPRGVMLSGVQFFVYLDGRVKQRSMGAGRDEWIVINP